MDKWIPQFSRIDPGRVLERTRNHLYIAPHPLLRAFVAHYTITFPAAGLPERDSRKLRLMPDLSGCLVFSMENSLPCRFWGATTETALVGRDFDTAPVRFFIEFQPGGAFCLTGLPMDEFTDSVFSADTVLPRLYRSIKAILEGEEDLPSLLCRMDSLLLKNLGQAEKPEPAAMLSLLLRGEIPSVRQIAEQSGYSERHLSRLFRSSLGVGIKTCTRVLRINKTLRRINPGASFTEIAAAAGYYDQAHFNHDFKAICGVSPTQYLASMSDFYKEKFKL
ncbi:helix-turn-helix domain-containing protein [Breznakiella homolactica]|uniref:Helix-turn-helix domain-containing protein n=1 Tax=Breznakiella homolactica TaxID=2798577 RepID=A0A7T7XJF9_9SPIR|nr:helix-turn-helix domain-containing protein [Breznakiella homolactica]QQO07501.1 helix-turn-helix domain-containing protein [Breznakiella homolactica]